MRRVKYELELASQQANSAPTPPAGQERVGMPDSLIIPLKKNKKAVLVQYAAFKGLDTSGTKAELVARLEE